MSYLPLSLSFLNPELKDNRHPRLNHVIGKQIRIPILHSGSSFQHGTGFIELEKRAPQKETSKSPLLQLKATPKGVYPPAARLNINLVKPRHL